MPDDSQIKIGMSIDTSGLSAARSQAQDSADQIAGAYQKVAAAALDAQNIQSRHRDILKNYSTGALDAATSTKLLSQNLAESASAAISAAQAEEALTVAIGGDTQATQSNITARMAASAELRVLEGNLMGSTRAAGAFLSTLPGIGAAMQVAFPIFGIAALIGILAKAYDSVEKLVAAYRDLDGAAIKASTEAILSGEKIVKIKADDFSNSFARVIAGAGNQPDAAVKSAAAQLKQIQNARELADAEAAVVEQGKTGVELQRQKIVDAQKDIDYAKQAKTQADALVESYRKQLEAKTTVVTGYVSKSGYRESKQEINTITDPKQVEAVQQQLKIAVSAADQFNHEIDMMKVKLEGAQVKLPSVQNKDAETQVRQQEALAKAQIEAKHAGDEALNPAQKITAELEKQLALHQAEEVSAQRMAALKGEKSNAPAIREAQDKSSYAAANAKVDDLALETLNKTFEDGEKAKQEAIKQTDEVEKVHEADFKRNHEEQMKMLQEKTAAAVRAASEKEDAAKKDIDYQEKLGILTPKQGSQQQLAAVNTAESSQVGALQAQQSQYHHEQGGDQAAQYEKIQDQIKAIQQKAADQRTQITQQETLREVAAWQQAYQQMTSAVVSATNTWMTSHKSFANSFIDAGKKLAVEFIDDLLRMGAKFVEQEAMKFAVHEGWVAATKSADVAASTAAVAIKAATNATMIALNAALAESAAGVAAAEAAAEAAPGGPLAAIAAGAAMYAAMTPFVAAASAEGGGFIPGHQGQAVPIIGHGKELVIPAPLSGLLNDAANSGTGGRSGHTFNSHSTINATVMDSRGLDGFARRAADTNGREMRKYARRINASN